MVLFHPFFSLKRDREVGWKRGATCFFSRFSFLRRYNWLCLAVFLTSILFASCSSLGFGGSPVASPRPKIEPTILHLSQLHWCDKPVMVFRNLAASGTPGVTSGNPTTLTDWAQVKPMLGFTVYLPTTLPTGSCLVSASGTVRDPVLGSNFVIGYVLPDHSSLTFSQAPQRFQSTTFQCSMAPNTGGTKATTPTPSAAPQKPVQFCSGARSSTNIVFSALGNTDTLQQFFNALQPDVSWVPVS